MDHNDFNFIDDLVTPLSAFMRQCSIRCNEPVTAFRQFEVPKEYFIIPKAYAWKAVSPSWSCFCMP